MPVNVVMVVIALLYVMQGDELRQDGVCRPELLQQ